jgi:hypothetical protein
MVFVNYYPGAFEPFTGHSPMPGDSFTPGSANKPTRDKASCPGTGGLARADELLFAGNSQGVNSQTETNLVHSITDVVDDVHVQSAYA